MSQAAHDARPLADWLRVAALGLGLLLASATGSHAQGPGQRTGDPEAEPARRSVLVRPDAPARLEFSGSRLELDPGSVDTPVEIEVATLAAAELPALDPGLTNVTGRGGLGFRFGPHGSRFRKALRLLLPFDESLLPRGKRAEEIRAYYFDEAAGRWLPLERVAVDPASRTIVSLTDHFTDIIAATLAVPTHPEVASFVPTMMLDMKAADPGHGLDVIQPPQPNPLGEARLTFPIELPPGRAGLQPALAIGYQSQGGNGWLGLGWTLSIPEIVVETRWGVPRYGRLPNAAGDIEYRNQETESYQLNGSALTPLAHRTVFRDRVGTEKVFHARVEGDFERIVRHGDHPGNFWWEVTDKNGVRSSYGEPPGAGAGPGTLRDAAGNIFRWALREVRDPHGNAMRFEYDLVSDPGVPGGAEPGRQLYPRAINYAGRSAGGAYEPGAYTVRFVRDSDPSLAPWSRRRDVQIDCRGGFKQVTAELLRQVRIELQGSLVRQYELDYEVGAFGKTRLAAVRQRGVDGAPFPGGEHRFAYHDDVRDGAGAYTSGFATESPWSVPFDDVTLCTDLGPVDVCPTVILPDHDRASALSGAITHAIGGHAYIGLNCGAPTKQNSAGAKTGFNHTRTDTRLALLDVDGDNLPDKVFRNGSGFVYRSNQSRPGGTPSFSATTRPLAGVEALSTETATTGSLGAEQYFFGTSALVNGTAGLSVGSAYTTDANGDGFVDVVRNGRILFSHLGPDGNLIFEPTSENTPQPLVPGQVDGDGIIGDHEPLFQELLEQHPLLDVFRRWTAPFDGAVRIEGDARLASPAGTEDGVRVSIQHNASVLWSALLPAGDAQVRTPAGVERVTVARGDRLYFRVQSVFDGAQDEVVWDPEIRYVDVAPSLDANRLDAHRYRASEDFVLGGRAGRARMPGAGEVRVTGVFEKSDTTSDDVTVSLLRNGASLFRETLPWDSVGVLDLDVRFQVAGDDTATKEVDEADRVHVHVSVDSPIDVRRIGWRADSPPELVFESISGSTARTVNGTPLVRLFLPSDLDLYPATSPGAPQLAWEAPRDGILQVTTALTGDWSFRKLGAEAPVADGEITFTIKRRGSRLARESVRVVGGRAENVTVGGLPVAAGDQLYFDFSMREAGARGSVGATLEYRNAESFLGTSPNAAEDVPCALHANVDFDDVAILGRGLFAQPHRGWACAGYDGNPDRGSPERPHACTGPRVSPTHPIDEADLVLDESLAQLTVGKQVHGIRTAIERQKAYALSPVHERLPDGTLRASWRGPDESGWVQPGRTSSTRIGVDLVGVPCASDLDPGDPSADGRAVPRIGNSVNAGAGAGFFIAVSGSAGRSSSNVDFVDLNGDQFPDVVGLGRAQFTLPYGGLETRNRSLFSVLEAIRHSNNLAGSISLGGTLPISKGNSKGTTGASNKSAARGERVENLMPSLGFSFDLGTGSSTVKSELLDVNGDGLPDRVSDDGTVSLNLGYSFAPGEAWPGLAGLDYSTSREFSLAGGIGFNDLIYGWAGGLSYTRAVSNTREAMLDLNGDGLVDRLREDGGLLWVAFNEGSGFAAETRWHGPTLEALARSANASLGGGVYVTIPVPIFLCSPVTVLFLIINPGATVSAGMARQETALLDVDGDRCLDLVRSTRDDELIVARNRTGRTNLLQRVERPLGGSFTLDYERQGNTPELPHAAWVLSKIELFDGLADDGPSPLLTTIAYAQPRYDRGEREFFGFAQVAEEHRDARDPARVERVVARTFRNDSYYSKGLTVEEATRDGQGRTFRSASQTHEFRDIATQGLAVSLASRTATIFPMRVSSESRLHEGIAGPGIGSVRRMEYDAIGNVVRVEDSGDPGPEDDLEATLTYATCPEDQVRSRPSGIVVRSRGITLAERQGTVDCATGDVVQIRQRLADGSEAVTDLEYSVAGQLQRVVGPANARGQRYALAYQYDAVTGAHVTRVEDSFGLVSQATHDARFGRPLSTTEPNGHQVTYAYDAFGRLAEVTGPYEQGTGAPALTFEYHPEAPVPWARTRHVDAVRAPLDPLETILFVDGLGRVVQTKVDATVHAAPDAAPEDVKLVSGRARFDALGRASEQHQPVTEPLGSGLVFNPVFDAVAPSRVELDVLDRPTLATQPDLTTTRYGYALAPDRAGILRHETTVTDANGLSRQLYRNSQDKLVGVREGAGGSLWTSFAHDALGRLVSITDANGNSTRMEYDQLGRRTSLMRPDAGTSRYEYDLASNLVALRTANLLKRHEAIRYEHDFTRLRAVIYPGEREEPDDDLGTGGPLPPAARSSDREREPERVTYEYGGPGAPGNGAGRVVRIRDAAGVEQRAYGKLGEVVEQRRSIEDRDESRHREREAYVTRYRYDTWGRLLELGYPDGELLTYDYDTGGRVRRAVGVDRGKPYEYLRRLEYDKFQQQAFLELGNGVRTSFTHRVLDQRLERLHSSGPGGTFQDLRYAYDPVGNVLSVGNHIGVLPCEDFGGASLQSYAYDDLYRLTGATGVLDLEDGKRDEYTLSLRYDAIHNLLEKRQKHEIVKPTGRREAQRKTSYAMRYHYSSKRPHAAIEVGDREFTYDANGNQTGWTHEENGTRQRVSWDDENRARSVSVQGHEIRYTYDAAGTRVLRRCSHGEVVDVNQFLTVRDDDDRTQHIYVGDTRLASRRLDTDDDADRRSGEVEKPRRHVLYYHPDHLGSVQFVTDGAGTVRQRLEYFPFGEIWVDEDEGDVESDLAFSGRPLDEETGLYGFGTRDQDPRLGQFLSVDPLSAGDAEQFPGATPASLNVYAFASGNPVRLVDPSGLAPTWWSRLKDSFSLFRGAAGHSVAAPRAPPTTSAALTATDSPVRAASAGGTGDFVAAAGVGVIATGPPPAARAAATRERSNAVVLDTPGARGPPAAASATTAAPAASETRARSNAVFGEGPGANLDGPPPVVVGENMTARVSPYAKSIGAETIVDWLGGRKWTQQLNDDFINWAKAEGREIIDIGPDFGRRLQWKLNPPTERYGRPVYESERQLLRGYANLRTIFVRLGKYEGGVPGFDVLGRREGGTAGFGQ